MGPMGSTNELYCEARSFSCCLNPHGFFQSEVLGFYFPTLEPWVARSVSLPSCSFWFIPMPIWDRPFCQLLPCQESSPPGMSVSAPPTSLEECFFVNSLVVGLPYSLIFCHFCLFFVFNFFVVLLLVVQGGKVYLPMSPCWLEVQF